MVGGVDDDVRKSNLNETLKREDDGQRKKAGP